MTRGSATFETSIEMYDEEDNVDAVNKLLDYFAPKPGQKVLEVEMQLGRVKTRECPPLGADVMLTAGVAGLEPIEMRLRFDRYQPSDGDGPAWAIYGRYAE